MNSEDVWAVLTSPPNIDVVAVMFSDIFRHSTTLKSPENQPNSCQGALWLQFGVFCSYHEAVCCGTAALVASLLEMSQSDEFLTEE